MNNYPPIDIWRMSASRPWHLEKTQSAILKFIKYSGILRYHLIESVLVEKYSEQCINWGKENGYNIHIISPARGQGYAINYALKNVIKSKYALKWEDDMRPEKIIPLDECFELMECYSHINQICFNKRETMSEKLITNNYGKITGWPKKQRSFLIDEKEYFLVVKDKWWFGPSIWRIDFIKSIYKYWPNNTHNLFNDCVLLPKAGYKKGDPKKNWEGRYVPIPEDIEKHIGCYIYGKTADSRMVEHIGIGDSIWAGEYQKKMKSLGKKIIGQ